MDLIDQMLVLMAVVWNLVESQDSVVALVLDVDLEDPSSTKL